MKRALMLGILVFPLISVAADSRWRYEDTETLHQTFRVAAGTNASKLIVDDLNGRIRVTGGSGSEIQVTAEKRMRAESESRLAAARSEVKLDMTQQGNNVKLYENGPFRSSDGSVHYDSDHYGYEVTFNCDIQVPEGVTLDLVSHNGAILVTKSTGDYTVRSHNGRIDMQEIAGNGSLETWNGAVKVAFSRNPTRDSSFHSRNGSVDLYFASTPDADLQLETRNGGVYSDFDVTTQPSVVRGENLANRFVYRNRGTMNVRAGKGGPKLSIETWNGTIRMHSKV